jgi:hypothetical protein
VWMNVSILTSVVDALALLELCWYGSSCSDSDHGGDDCGELHHIDWSEFVGGDDRMGVFYSVMKMTIQNKQSDQYLSPNTLTRHVLVIPTDYIDKTCIRDPLVAKQVTTPALEERPK